MGSTLSSILLPSHASIADGLLAFALLIGAQFAVAWLEVRSGAFRRLVTSHPTLLFYRGDWLDDTLRRERIARSEILFTVRSSGIAHLDEVEAVVLETDGSLSVVRKPSGAAGRSTISNVAGVPSATTAD